MTRRPQAVNLEAFKIDYNQAVRASFKDKCAAKLRPLLSEEDPAEATCSSGDWPIGESSCPWPVTALQLCGLQRSATCMQASSDATITLTQTKLGDYLIRINGQPACVEAAREAIDCIDVYTFPISCLKSAWLSSRRSSPMRGSFNLKDIMTKTETYVELPSFSLGQLDSGIGTIVAARATSVRRALDLMELDNIVVEHIDTDRIKSIQPAHARKEWWSMLSERTDTFIHCAFPHGANYIIVVGRQRGIIDVKRRLTVVADTL